DSGPVALSGVVSGRDAGPVKATGWNAAPSRSNSTTRGTSRRSEGAGKRVRRGGKGRQRNGTDTPQGDGGRRRRSRLSPHRQRAASGRDRPRRKPERSVGP